MQNINHEFLFSLFLGICLGMIFMNFYMKYQARQSRKWFALRDTKNPENQLRFLDAANLQRVAPMGFEAYQRFRYIEEFLTRRDFNGYRVFAETCMGAFMQHKHRPEQQYSRNQIEAGFRCKRVDFLIINPKGFPVLAVEYHGSGHFNHDWEARDKVKAKALQKAQIPLLVLYKETSKEDVLNALNVELKKANSRR